MQNLHFILKIRFNNDEPNPQVEEMKILHMIETEWGVGICCQARVLTLCSHIEKVRKSMLKRYFKIENINSGIQFNCKENNKQHQHFWKIIKFWDVSANI